MNDNELQALKAAVDNSVAALTGVQEAVDKAILVIGGQRQDNERLMNDLAAIRGERDEQYVRANNLETELRRMTLERDGALGTIEEMQSAAEAPTPEIEPENPVANPAVKSTGSKKGNEKQA